jgi:hypothetical protein
MDRKDTSAIVGCPGIGKSWQLEIYALQQALLYDGANVVLCVGKEENFVFVFAYIVCLVQKRLYELFILDAMMFCSCTTLQKSKVTVAGVLIFARSSCQVIVAMSANDAHNLNAQDKQERGVGYFNRGPPTS